MFVRSDAARPGVVLELLRFDRSAAALYFAAPLSLTKVLTGKNLAALICIYLEVLMVIGVTVALGLSAGLGSAVETLVVMGICALYLLALGNLGSVRYPRGLSGERVAHGGGRGFQGFLFLIYPVALMPVGLAYLARYAFENDVVFGVVLAISGVIGGVFYWIALESAVKSAGKRGSGSFRNCRRAMGRWFGIERETVEAYV